MNVYGLNIKTGDAFKQKTRLLDFVYLHGILEDKNKYDLVGVTENTYSVINTCYFGKFDVDVILQNGDKENGILFYWHDNENRRHGLIVDKTDTESIIYAQDKFDNRANTL